MRKNPFVRSSIAVAAALAGMACVPLIAQAAANVMDATWNAAYGPADTPPQVLAQNEDTAEPAARRRAPRRPGTRFIRRGPPSGEAGAEETVPGYESPTESLRPPGGDWTARRWAGKEGGLPPADLEAPADFPPVPDRWRIVDTLGYPVNLWDPYHGNNVLKADKPAFGKDWFFNLGVISDTLLERRHIPVPVGGATTARPNSLDTIGDGTQTLLNESLIVEAVLYQGNTVFRPPDYEFRFTPVFNFNYLQTDERGLVKVDPTAENDGGKSRTEGFIGVQALFVDKHLRNVSDRYDFDSLRVGIQPITADFRGFLFIDEPLGVRLFGTRDNNLFQYNLAWFRRFDKDVNSGLNNVTRPLRDDDVFLANVYRQDFPRPGFTSQATVVYNRNREKDEVVYDTNGFIARPGSLFAERGRDYDVTYLGYNGDGHLGRLNLSASFYYAYGDETNTRFRDGENDIRAWFGAAEASWDLDWMRVRLSGLYASGDDDPFDDESNGFDAIFENPRFAGADSSYYISQSIPLIGGGGVFLTGRNGLLNSLRSSKEQGQSNFTNPGIRLLGVGADFDLLPQLRVSANVNQLWFADTEVLEVLRQQADIGSGIGTDLSVSLIYRPLFNQNVVLRVSAAMLLPGQGFKDLYGDDNTQYSMFGNLILTY